MSLDNVVAPVETVPAKLLKTRRAGKSGVDPISAPKRTHPPGWTPKTSKFDDKYLLKVELPTREERQWYLSEKLEDGLSLRMVIGFGGAKKWSVATYPKGGRTVQTPLGLFPDLRTGDARKKAYAVLKEMPQRTERETRNKAAGTFGEVSRAWFEAEIAPRSLISESEIKRRLTKYVWPQWEDKPFGEIKRSDTTTLLDGIQQKIQQGKKQAKGGVQTDAIAQTLAAVFSWMVDRMYDDWVPPIPQNKRSVKTKRDRVLTDEELKAVWETASAIDDSDYGRFVQFLPLVAQRGAGKVLLMKRKEIRDDTWFIPKTTRQKRCPSYIKLSPLALKILNKQLASHDNERVWGCVALSRHKREFNKRYQIAHWTLHDLRRTARTRIGKLKTPEGNFAVLPFVAEAVLGHRLKASDVEDTYNINDYSDEVSQALNLWSIELAKIVGENVVDINQKKRA